MSYASGVSHTEIKDAGVVFPPLRSLAIVGSHPDSREKAPFDDPNYEIFLFNEAPQKPEIYRRWDTCLQIHIPEVYSSETNWVNKDHWKWLQQDHGPDKRIFMQEVDPRVPNSIRYPIEGVRSLVPYKYLRSSPAMALALAIYLGYKDISLYGNDLSSNTEYHYQATNYTFWIGFAHGRGINLDMQCWRSEFFEQPIYGYEGELQLEREHFLSLFNDHQIVHKMKNKAFEKIKDKLKTAMLESKFEKVGEISLDLEISAIATGESFGAMQEAKRYSERTDHISRQEFERVSAQAQLDGEGVEKLMHHEAGKCEYVWNVWKQTGNLEALQQLRAFMDKRTELAFDMGKHLGIFRENTAFMNEYDQRVQAAGGKRAVYFEGRETVTKSQSLGNKA
jgi:hypothetical protein